MKSVRVESVAQMEQLMPLILESLASGKSVRFSPMGKSMLPMLRQGKDSVVLSPITGRLKKYDLPLYRRNNGKYVLHRIVSAGETYTCMGDNQSMVESGICQEQLIGVVTAFYRGERYYSVNHPVNWLYCRLWRVITSMRYFFRRADRWVRRHLS